MPDVSDFLLIDQLKLMGFGESDTSGCWIKLQVTEDEIPLFRGKKGCIFEVAIREVDNSGEYVKPVHGRPPSREDIGRVSSPATPDASATRGRSASPNGQFWHDLFVRGFFNAPQVLEAIGTPEDFEAWIRKQPSCVSGNQDWNDKTGEGQCEPAHVRRVSEGAGASRKPPYFIVPLTHKEHETQHHVSEAACLRGDGWEGSDAEAKEFFERQAVKYRYQWASQTLAEQLGAEGSRADVPPEDVIAWCEERDLMHLIPERWREAA